MANPADARRRFWGAFFLTLASGMLVWGETVFEPYLEQAHAAFVIYWAGCFVSTTLAMIVALLDIRAMRLRLRSERKDLVERTLQDLERDYLEHSHQPSDEQAKP